MLLPRVQFVLFNHWIMFLNLSEYFKITFHLYNLGNDPLKRWKNLECWLLLVQNAVNIGYLQTHGKVWCHNKSPKITEDANQNCLKNSWLYPVNGERNLDYGLDCRLEEPHHEFEQVFSIVKKIQAKGQLSNNDDRKNQLSNIGSQLAREIHGGRFKWFRFTYFLKCLCYCLVDITTRVA